MRDYCCANCKHWLGPLRIERSGIQMPHGIPAEWCYNVAHCSQWQDERAEWQGCRHHKRRRRNI